MSVHTMALMVTLIGGLAVLVPHTSGVQVDPALPFSDHLDPSSQVLLRWGFDLVKDSILFEVRVKTTGWIGIGFSPTGGMMGSDMVIGGVGPAGIYFTDRYGVGDSMPQLDEQQDYKLISLTEAEGETLMKFQRSIRACDKNDFPITNVPIKLIYAYGENDNIGYHGSQRGTKELNLLNYMPRTVTPDSQSLDLTMTNFSVPAQKTYYHCKILNLTTPDRKYHIYRIEPIIQNPDLVHHMLLYQCPPTVTNSSEQECYTERTGESCIHVIAVWGVGGGAFELPEAAGIPIGGEGKVVFYRLEVHYNNPTYVSGRVDSSGLRFHYTSQLRQHDAGVLQTGLAVIPGNFYAIPPNASEFQTYGLCDSGHIPRIVADHPHHIQVFAAILHTHLAGITVRVGQFRDGQQIDFLAMNEHYDFEMQQVTHLGKTKTLQMGDQLLVQCIYNTSKRTQITWGGLGTTDEMCLAFLYYYPAMNISQCVSLPNMTPLMGAMGAADYMNWVTLMRTKSWNQTSVTEYQQILTKIPQHTAVIETQGKEILDSGLIPDLRLAPSVVCTKSGGVMVSPAAGELMLIGVTAALMLF